MSPSKSPLDFSSLSLKELRHIYLLHQNLNFIRAAKLAGITQSALSQSIANIEQRMGIELIKAPSNEPWKKPFVESFNNTLRRMFFEG